MRASGARLEGTGARRSTATARRAREARSCTRRPRASLRVCSANARDGNRRCSKNLTRPSIGESRRAMRSSSMGSTAKPQTGAMATVTKGLFQKSLRDIITGIRANKDRQKDYMNKCLQDIRAEVSFCDVRVFRGCRTTAARARARGRSRRGVSRSRNLVRASGTVRATERATRWPRASPSRRRAPPRTISPILSSFILAPDPSSFVRRLTRSRGLRARPGKNTFSHCLTSET